MSEVVQHYDFVVVGGGISGVTCVETLSQLKPDVSVLLVTASPILKAVTNFRKVTRALEDFEIEERPMFEFSAECPNIAITQTKVSALNAKEKILKTADGKSYSYSKLCICTGGKPKLIANENPHILGIRDTETVKVFQERLGNAKRIVVVGNGGIATEIVYEIEGCEIVWAIKDDTITATFIDAGAATFFLPHLCEDKDRPCPKKRTKYSVDDPAKSKETVKPSDVLGNALGPDWHAGLELHGEKEESHRVHVEYKVEVAKVYTPQEFLSSGLKESSHPASSGNQVSWPVYIELTNGKVFGCDFVVSATGVIPNMDPFLDRNNFRLASDGGVCVNEQMETSEQHVYAAGDVCHADWEPAPHWQQMRLWHQARQMGAYAAKCMIAHKEGDTVHMDFCFELFAHITKFFNYKVVLLGKFNAQGLGENHELMVRVTKGLEYVKIVLQDGRMQGAILIGETDLEETFENLILNRMDLSSYGEDLLDPNFDIEDYFD